ncbi:MAG: NADH-quinone oxidoreductase subunit J [Ignavibacteriales bacterium]|nr:NADH-quinone oxidoreductase subunit J [Ignavibacteriales bacterium]
MNIELIDIIFYFLAIVVIASASVVVFSRNILYSAFSLLFTFVGVAGLYVLLTADFLAITQLVVYVGGILVLILFGVMLTNNVFNVDIKTGSIKTLPALVLTAVMAGVLCGIFFFTQWTVRPSEVVPTSTAPAIGMALMTGYILPFEVASVVLLVAMIGAAMIARRDTGKQN